MDRLHFPPAILNNNPNISSPVPKHIKTWGQLKQLAASNPQLLGGVDIQKLMALQKLHLAQILAQSKEGGRGAEQVAAADHVLHEIVRERAGIAGIVDVAAQHAALQVQMHQPATFGQAAFSPGDVKNTYGTGCFLLQNTGTTTETSSHGLVTTVAYQVEDQPAHYALEGSVAVAGSLVQWLRDNLGLIRTSEEVEALAGSVEDNGGVYFVPAFSGLYAPHWRPDARGLIAGLTGYATAGHLARAAVEATAYQTRDVLEAVVADTGQRPEELRVDGGMTVNDDLMQFQADILGVPVVRPLQTETTAAGAAHAAGLSAGLWSGLDELAGLWQEDRRWEPRMDAARRDDLLEHWDRAVAKSMDWVQDGPGASRG